MLVLTLESVKWMKFKCEGYYVMLGSIWSRRNANHFLWRIKWNGTGLTSADIEAKPSRCCRAMQRLCRKALVGRRGTRFGQTSKRLAAQYEKSVAICYKQLKAMYWYKLKLLFNCWCSTVCIKITELMCGPVTDNHMIIVYLSWQLSTLDTKVFCCQGRFSMLLNTFKSLFKNQDVLEVLVEGTTVSKALRYWAYCITAVAYVYTPQACRVFSGNCCDTISVFFLSEVWYQDDFFFSSWHSRPS